MGDSSPRFRHDLIATAVEVDGVRYIDVRDPSRGVGFRFYDFEYELARQLDGRPASDVSAWAITTYGLDLTPAGIDEFAARLAELGFLEASAPAENSARTTLVGQPPARDPRTLDEDARTVSEVVSHVVLPPPSGSAPPPASPPPTLVTVVASPNRRPSQELPVAGSAGAARSSGPRDLVRVDQTLPETMMGFAAVTEPVQKQREMSVEPSEAIGTVMGFAAVTEEQVREAEAAAAARAAAAPITAGSGRVVAAPLHSGERRQPPRPESVVMAPFEVEEMRRRTVSQAIRRPVSAADRSTIVVVLLVAVAVIAAVIAYYFWTQHEAAMEARRVRTVAPRPAAVYRWFDAPGSAVVAGSTTLAFAAGGSVADVLPPGSHYAAGEVIAKLQGAAARESEVNHSRSRVAYNQQIRDSMKAANNLTEMRKAEIAIVEKQAKLDEAEASLDRLVIRALEAGEVVEVIAKRGTIAEPNVPAVRVRSGQIHGEFILAAKDAEAAAHLGFCRVQIVGVSPAAADPRSAAADAGAGAGTARETGPRFADCRLTAPPQPPNNRLEVELPPSAGILLGQPLLLARVRYDGVFPVPRSAIVRVGDTDRIFVVGPGNVAQARAITIADADPDEVVLSQGIDVGDRVIVDPPADLRDGTPLSVIQ
jgi:hypothetical protein